MTHSRVSQCVPIVANVSNIKMCDAFEDMKYKLYSQFFVRNNSCNVSVYVNDILYINRYRQLFIKNMLIIIFVCNIEMYFAHITNLYHCVYATVKC